ncbi:Exportin-6 [Dissophora globulifera]|nr:Exportin-6 [Dissophora globulifera]
MDALEHLLAEFFGAGTSTERKRSIEAQLDAQQLTLDDCRYMLTNAQSDYLAWFAASQYQKRIQTEWSSLDPELQHANRSFLLAFLQQHFESAPAAGASSSLNTSIEAGIGIASPTSSSTANTSARSVIRFSAFVLNKVVQLVTDIALQDWPDRFQDLFPEIQRLLQSKTESYALLGWTLLEAVVQEFVGVYPAPGSGKSHRAHLIIAKQRWYLWETFRAQIPDLLSLIVQHLDTSYNKMLVTPLSTEAPAPSPVEHSVWGTSNFGRRPSGAPQPNLALPSMQMTGSSQSSFSASRTVPGSVASSFATMAQSSYSIENGQRQAGQGDQSTSHSFGKSPTTMLRKSLSQFLGGPANPSSTQSGDSASHINLMQSPVGSGFSLLQARQRMGHISDLGQMAMRRNSINAAVMMDQRRGSVDNTFISGNRMDSHSRKTCMLALQALTTLLACPGLDPRQVSLVASVSTVLKFATLHQNKTVDLGILALSCLNGLVARPGFLATNQDAMTGAVRVMGDLIRYFNEVKDGIDDIDDSYLQMFMHFVSLFCTLLNLERAEKSLGLSKAEFLASFARFTLEKVSVEYLKVCMDVWKSLLDALINSAVDTPRPIPEHDPIRRIQAPLLYFMSTLVENFYKMKGATQSDDAFSTFEVEDEDDLDELTELVESFVGLVAEVFTEEVLNILTPLLDRQLEFYSRQDIDECQTLPVTLGILSRVAYNLEQNFEYRRAYTSDLIVRLTRMTKLSIDYYLAATNDAASPGKGQIDLIGTITLALFDCLAPLIPWVNSLWKIESDPELNSNGQARTPIAKEIYQELAQLSAFFFQRLLPTSSSTIPIPGTFLGPLSSSCLLMDRKLLLVSARTLSMITLQIRIPARLLLMGECLFWDLEATRTMASCLGQIVMTQASFMGTDFVSLKEVAGGGSGREEERKGMTPNDELVAVAYLALSNGIVLDPKANPDLQAAALQAFGSLVAPVIYPLQSILQDSRSNPNPRSFLSNPEVKFRVHRCLVLLRTLTDSVAEATTASRIMVYEGLKTALPLVQEYFEVYHEDHDIAMDILLLFHALIKSLYRQIGMGYSMEIARVLIDRVTYPSLLETAFSNQQNGQATQHTLSQHQTLHQQSYILQRRKVLQRIQISLSILKSILELPGKEVANALGDFTQFLFMQLGPRLLGVQDQQHRIASGEQGTQQQSGMGDRQEEGLDNGVYDLLTLFFNIIETILTHHCRSLFTSSTPTTNAAAEGMSAAQRMLQSSMEYLARGLHRPEPDVVRHSVEILRSSNRHSLCHLFSRREFQQTYRFEFLQVLLRLALSHRQDLLLEDMAELMHEMVKGPTNSSKDEQFLSVWNNDLMRFVAALEPALVLSATSASMSTATGSNGATRQYPDSAKNALWTDLLHLGDGSMYREGLYDFVNDAQVYARNLSL